jgi:hypothetical protein
LNLTALAPSRRPPREGDIFVLRPLQGPYLYGRVISTEANPLGVGGALLVYIYRARSPAKLPVPELSPHDLLVPPIMTNRQPWSKGYFEIVERRPLRPEDRLARHCFRDDVRGGYRDEMGTRVEHAVEPVGEFGLHSFRTIDDEVSKALGLPLSAD